MRIVLENFAIKPKARPRLGAGGRVYSPTSSHERSLAWELRAHYPGVRYESPVSVECAMFGKQRGDLDNCIKTLLDALQKAGIIKNDKQVRRIVAEYVDSETKSVIVEIDECR